MITRYLGVDWHMTAVQLLLDRGWEWHGDAWVEPLSCSCRSCNMMDVSTNMTLCPNCGNKRCPRANNHRNACTNSNAPGQPGSAYP